MVCANMSCKEKLELLVIGKSRKPRCFKGVKSIPVLYESNKKAWMTCSVYEDWLHKIDHKFQRENRKVLPLVDNCPAHPKVLIQTLKAIKVVHIPPNLTAKMQPMDQGIIQNLKVNYRQRIIKRLLKASDKKMWLTDLNLLDAIFDLNEAWADVTSDIIANCFQKASFVKTDVENLATQEQDEMFYNDLQRMLGFTEVTIEYFINVDTNVIIANEPTDSEILNSIKAQGP
ncbi:tigger transposable element-derived protein 4-like [Belonocnema kinseyi]|uniref:tigger transposable element-derived protein 4-like n=1 Tax=Belonocnema kinseyi TaxID=2817044 RepID=UPI00143DA852|nr:tigger transposable element-derived protein 4-like [Belonocnema kinseyi]